MYFDIFLENECYVELQIAQTCTINKEIYKLTVQNKLDTEMQLISKTKPD